MSGPATGPAGRLRAAIGADRVGIDLEHTTVSMTINSPASVLWAMYLVVAEKQGADWKKISGTL